MTLRDGVREATGQIRDVLAQSEKKRRGFENEVVAADKRLQAARSRLSSQRDESRKLKSRSSEIECEIRDLRSQIDRIEQQRVELLDRLSACQEEQEEFKRKVSEAEDGLARMQSEVDDARTAKNQVLRRIGALDSEESRQKSELLMAARKALSNYLAQEARFLGKRFSSQSSYKENLAQLESLKNARHRNLQVSGLCEAREEWKRVLETVSVPPVKASAEAELTKVESELNDMFPGALDAEMQGPPEDLTCELYYFIDGSQRLRVFLPLSISVWKNLSASDHGDAEELAMRVFWSIAEAFNAKPARSAFEIVDDHLEFVSEEGREEFSEHQKIAVPFAIGNNLHLFPTRLPEEVQEVLDESQVL